MASAGTTGESRRFRIPLLRYPPRPLFMEDRPNAPFPGSERARARVCVYICMYVCMYACVWVVGVRVRVCVTRPRRSTYPDSTAVGEFMICLSCRFMAQHGQPAKTTTTTTTTTTRKTTIITIITTTTTIVQTTTAEAAITTAMTIIVGNGSGSGSECE